MSKTVSRSTCVAILGLAACAAPPLFAAGSAAGADAEASPADAASPESPSDAPDSTWLGEAVRVTAKGTAADVPSALATENLAWQDSVATPQDFQDLIVRVPGVGATGQNGLFETFSIRGSGANGILILVGGMPVTAQRRAGVPVAFVEPALLGDISVTRGPAVVHYGPGALGGAISIEPRWFDAPFASAGYASAGNETMYAAGIGSEHVSIGVARHRAGDSESANGVPLNTSFERESATLQFRSRLGEFDFDGLLIPSRTENIGKSNSRYPARDTTYPEDTHTLGRLRLRHEGGFEASVHAHDQYLGTWNQRPGTPDTFAAVQSLDIGATVQQTFETGAFRTNIGLEYLGRKDVTAYDAQGSVNNRTYSLYNAAEDGWSVFAIGDWQVAPDLALEFGGRWSTVDQDSEAATLDDSDSAFTAGAVWTPTDSSRWSLNLSSGYRFATLEERFYSGITAQGEVVGNPDLGSEHSLGVDLGYAWHAGNWGAEVHVWRNDVDDLIQLIDLAPEVNGYANVGEAELHGAEATIGWTLATGLELRGSMALVRGEDTLTGDPLYGIPPLTAELEAKYHVADFIFGARYSHRWKMDRPGFEEVGRDAVDLFDLDVRYSVLPSLDLQFYVRNLFDEDYYATADELSTFGQERSVGVNVTWTLR